MDIMIDIETYSTKSNALILCIGAIKFDPNLDSLDINSINKFYCLIDIEHSKKFSFDIEKSCTDWWEKQPLELRKEIFESTNRVTIKKALLALNNWIGESKFNNVWAQGMNFDFPILENAYNIFNIDIPWKFWQLRDSRTLCEVCKIPKSFEFNDQVHHPIYDCYRQILSVQKAFKKIRK